VHGGVVEKVGEDWFCVSRRFADGEARHAGAEGTGSAWAFHHWLAPPTHSWWSRVGSGRPRARSFL